MNTQRKFEDLPRPLQAFARSVPRLAYCSENPRAEGIYRETRESALEKRHIQPNTLKLHSWIVLDVDQPGAAHSWRSSNCPPPNITTTNPRTGHAHLMFQLSAPVATTEIARIHPVQYLAAVEHGLNIAFGGDIGYKAVITQNPLNPHWLTECPRNESYDIGELAEWVTLPKKKEVMQLAEQEEYAGRGRNCYLFENLRKVSYRAWLKHRRPAGDESFLVEVRGLAESLNATLGNPLGTSEVRTIAKSVARWVWREFTNEEFRAIQSKRGQRKGEAKRKELLERAVWLQTMGHSMRDIAKELGIGVATAHRWLNRP